MAGRSVEAREILPGVHLFERIEPAGWTLGMIVVRLESGASLVYSPTWFGEDTFARVEGVGRPAVLVAPNHFHHLSLGRFRARYPEAVAVAGERALGRLRKKGHEGLHPAAKAAGRVGPHGVSLIEPAGLKNGEVWLSLEGENGGGRTWIVGDAFFNMNRPVRGVFGFMARRLRVLPGLCLGRTFLWVGVGDAPAYRAWALEALAARGPRRMGFCHGDPIEGEDLPDRLRALILARVPSA